MNRKLLIAIIVLPLLAVAAFLAYQNTPTKRYARHLVKARLFSQEGNLTAARLEYEKAYNATEGYTPWASVEVLEFSNRVSFSEKNPEEAQSNTRKFVEKYPDNINGRLILADLCMRMGDIQGAFREIEAILTQDPDNFKARVLLIQMRTSQGRLDLAEEQLRYLAEKNPDSLQTTIPLAENLLRQGKGAEARTSLQAALTNHADDPRLKMLMVDSYLAERKIDSAQALLASWRQADPKVSLAIQVRSARLLALQGLWNDALISLAEFREKSETNLPALEQIALIYVQKGEYDSALKVFEIMGEAKPSLRGGLKRLGVYLHLKNGNPAKALEEIKGLSIGDKAGALLPLQIATYLALDQGQKVDEILSQAPDSVNQAMQKFRAQLEPDAKYIGYWALLNFYQLTNQSWPSFQTLRDWQKQWPKNRLATKLFAANLTQLRLHADALKMLESLTDTSLAHQEDLIRLHLAVGKRDRASAMAKALSQAHPKEGGLRQLLGDLALEAGRSQEATAYYEEELKLQPKNIAVVNNLAWEYGVTQKDFAKAKPYLDQLKAMKLLDPRIYDTIGWAMVLGGQNDSAKAYLKTALDLVPDHPTFNFHEAYRLAITGDKIQAKKRVESALRARTFPEKASADSLSRTL